MRPLHPSQEIRRRLAQRVLDPALAPRRKAKAPMRSLRSPRTARLLRVQEGRVREGRALCRTELCHHTARLRWPLLPSSSTRYASASCPSGSSSTLPPRRGATCDVPSPRGCASSPTPTPDPEPLPTPLPRTAGPNPEPEPHQVRLNADNLEELERIDRILAEVCGG